MSGKSENIVSYTAEEVEAMGSRGEGRTNWNMSHDEAMRRRHADPDAPQPYPGWEETVSLEPPSLPKEQITLRLDRDVLEWFRARGRGYQTRINAVLRAYYLHERRKEP
jgi:uncharacterized protein (DUF4415 family)